MLKIVRELRFHTHGDKNASFSTSKSLLLPGILRSTRKTHRAVKIAIYFDFDVDFLYLGRPPKDESRTFKLDCALDPADIYTGWMAALHLVSTPAHGVEDPFLSKPVCFVRSKPDFYKLVERGLHYLTGKWRQVIARRSATEKGSILP